MASVWACFLLLGLAMAAAGVRSQSTDDLGLGFISIDCGVGDGAAYVDPKTNISYVSDQGFTDTGVNRNISAAYVTAVTARRWLNVRSFPNGTRNCYTIRPITKGSKYLVRTMFMHGNYDGTAATQMPVVFHVYLGVNYWTTINVTSPDASIGFEAIAVAPEDFLWVCLVNTGGGTPFLTGLDVRPLKDTLYPMVNASRALSLYNRAYLGSGDTSIRTIRYPDDRLDRYWKPWGLPSWTGFSTKLTVQNVDNARFDAPSAVMQNAVTPINSTELILSWAPDPGDVNEYYAVLHISELFNLTGTNMSRQFEIYACGIRWLRGFMTPDYLYADEVYSINPLPHLDQYNITLQALSNSTLKPILNAFEIYSKLSDENVGSDVDDVNSMMAIKEWYQIKRNWNGDPCSPKMFAWNGVTCTYSLSNSPRVTTLNLSTSGLTGEINESFASLGAVEYLDLSNNNLTGTIPSILAEITTLKVLDLTNNQLNGSIPSALLEKSQNGFLTLRVMEFESIPRIEGNPSLCDHGASCKVIPTSSKKKIATPVIVILCVVPVVVLLVVIAIIFRLRKTQGFIRDTAMKPQSQGFSQQVKDRYDDSLQLENRQFTYMELKNITNNFQKVLGKGGFGTVFHGCLENGTQVAVKMRSQTALQGVKEFLAEAQHLTRVHHRNLVSLVGYCNDGNYLALVYEYMSQGTLQDHLRGRKARPLSWRQRLRIGLEAAQGLEYLHQGCKPPLIHRDVKTANILLSENLEAKIADLGLSKAFQNEVNTHVSTAVMGTPGYLDPEYYNTFKLSGKSDVYSFGVVLLELITGLPPLLQSPENGLLVQLVRQRLARGDIEDVIDPMLQGQYDVNSVWKCADTALKCTVDVSNTRPSMVDIVLQLKESLELETSRDRTENLTTCSENLHTEVSDINQNSILEIENVARMSSNIYGPSAR